MFEVYSRVRAKMKRLEDLDPALHKRWRGYSRMRVS